MKKADVQTGGCYVAKVSGVLTVVRIDRAAPSGSWFATNVATGRTVRVRGAARLRYPARPERARTPCIQDIVTSLHTE